MREYLIRYVVTLLAADPTFPAVFGKTVGHGLPLHVAAVVRAAGAQGLDVVDDVARAGASALASGRARVFALEGRAFRCGAGLARLGVVQSKRQSDAAGNPATLDVSPRGGSRR